MSCGKIRFKSIKKARHTLKGYRIRVYFCKDCKAYHRTNNEKQNDNGFYSSENRQARKRKRR